MAPKLIGLLKLTLPKVPMIIAATFSHFIYGPPKPSWSFRFSLTVALLRSFIIHLNHTPIKQSQILSRLSEEDAPVRPGAIASTAMISQSYREKAAQHMERLFNLQGVDVAKLGWDWRTDPAAEEPLLAEWTEMANKDKTHSDDRTILYLHGGGYFLGSILTHRWATAKMAHFAGAKVLSIDYRLAPDSPFPAAVVDTMAAYLYLLYPPAESGASPVDAANIVIMGDSAGGGLAFAAMLAIRDAGLPMPAGIVGLSPWLDLLHSMPSVLTNVSSDYLPAEGFTQGGQGSIRQLGRLAASVGPEYVLLHHPDLPEIQYYASNAMLGSPYVSPLLENNLEGACPMLVISGDGEMLRDEAIVFAKKNASASPTLHLLMYDDMPHVFPMFDFLPGADHALQQAGNFIRSVTAGGQPLANKSSMRVDVDGRLRPLEENAVVGWEERLGKLGGGHDVLVSLQ